MIPYNTDAPVNYFPYTTIGLIVVNTLLFFAVPADFKFAALTFSDGEALLGEALLGDMAEDQADPEWERIREALQDQAVEYRYPPYTLALQYGAGIKPWQWFSSIFMHADFFHLLFNMIFLWAFGLVVEGKVGPKVFLLLYLGIGVIQSGLEQTLMCIWGEGASIGASAAVFGILGVAIVWAPRNDFDVFWIIGFHVGTVEIPIMMFGFIKFAMEFINMAFGRFAMSSAVLHLMGFGIGITAGFVWLRRQWVDCEGWDIINVWKGNEGQREERDEMDAEAVQLVRSSLKGNRDVAQPVPAEPGFSASSHQFNTAQDPNALAESLFSPNAQADQFAVAGTSAKSGSPDDTGGYENHLKALIAAGDFDGANRMIEGCRQTGTPYALTQSTGMQLVKGLLATKRYAEAIPLMEELAKQFPKQRVPVLFTLAKLQLQLGNPLKAQRVLKVLRSEVREPSEQKQWQALAAKSKKMIAAANAARDDSY